MEQHRAWQACFTIVAVLGAAILEAQSRPPERVYTVSLTARAGMVQAFEDYVKKVGEAAEKTGAPQHWAFYQVTLGGPGRTCLVGLYLNDWAEMDGWSQVRKMLTEAFGEREGAQILARGTAAIERFREPSVPSCSRPQHEARADRRAASV